MKSGLLLLFVISAASSNVAHALKEPQVGKLLRPEYQKVTACADRPEFVSEVRLEPVGSLDKLPSMGVLVAREAEYYIEGQTERGAPVKVHGYQSFVADSKNKILCGTGSHNMQERFSVMAPTLIDTTQAQKIGNSVWQFQILAKGDQFSAFNMKSLGNLAKVGSQYQIYQVSPNEYEMMVVQEKQGVRQYLSIRYDAIASR